MFFAHERCHGPLRAPTPTLAHTREARKPTGTAKVSCACPREEISFCSAKLKLRTTSGTPGTIVRAGGIFEHLTSSSCLRLQAASY
jgi:hypothetical protein